MKDNERQFEDFVASITFDDTPDANHRDKLEQELLRTLAKQAPRQTSVWRMIMKSRITKLAAAAGVVLAVLVGIKIFSGSAEGPPATVERQRIVEKLHTELREVRQMAAVGDVKGLARMLSAGQFESKLVAANFLAKMGDLPALEAMSMHASGELILDIQSGNIRLHSTNSPDWLGMTADTLWVHTGQSVHEAKQVRLTYDRGDDEDWENRRRAFADMRQERADLEGELTELSQSPPKDIAQLRKRLAQCNEILDLLDGAVYVSIENGLLKLHCPTYDGTALAELRDGIVRVESHGNVVEADSITLLHRLAPVRTDGPPLPTPGWRERFDKVYSLDDGEVLRWVRYPFIPERQIYATQELHYYRPPGYLYFRFNGELYNWMLGMDEGDLRIVLTSMGLEFHEFWGPTKLISLKLEGDWIERKNAPMEDKLSALEKILEDGLGRRIRFEKPKTDIDVIIVSGRYKRVLLDGVKRPHAHTIGVNLPSAIYVYPDSAWGRADFGGMCSLVELIERIGRDFNQPTVFEAEDLPEKQVSYYFSNSYSLARANAKTKEEKQEILDSVLQNLSKQTSLQFEYGQRDKDVWFITEQSKTE